MEINYFKIISRNRFYYPIFDKKLVLALSLSGGYQINQPYKTPSRPGASAGYIPSIKIFRLEGYDILRGFAHSEANRLADGQNINEVQVKNAAYFANFKFEPRRYISDSVILGLFFDSGGLFLDSFQPLKMRSSMGVSFKFLTPVGTLDFDYGIKLRRKTWPDGTRDGFGRFHMSIGLF